MNKNQSSRTTCECPVSRVLKVLSGPWTMYIMWVLRNEGQKRFGELRLSLGNISSRVLTERLRLLEREGFLVRKYEPSVPPQVTYSVTARAMELNRMLDELNGFAERWFKEDEAKATHASTPLKKTKKKKSDVCLIASKRS